MYMRVTTGTYDSAREDEVQLWIDQQLVPGIQKLPGFRAYHGGLNRTTGHVVAVSSWDTQQQAEGLRDNIGDLLGQITALGVKLEPSQVYEQVVNV